MSKTPEYTKKAVNNYRSKFDLIQIRLPKGTKDRIQAAGHKSTNDYIVSCVLSALDTAEHAAQAPEMPVEPIKIEKPKYLPLTPENVAKVDLGALIEDGNTLYQLEVSGKFGMDGFNKLVQMAKAKKESGE